MNSIGLSLLTHLNEYNKQSVVIQKRESEQRAAFRFRIAQNSHVNNQSVLIRMQLLSQNAILHISAGFEGPFMLQAFSVKKDLYQRGVYRFCVTDGTVYIGARFDCGEQLELSDYNLVQVTAKFQDRFHPITCKTLDIVSTSLRRLLGQPPTTLQDFLNREVFPQSEHPAPRKIIKQNLEEQKSIKRQSKEVSTPHRDEPKYQVQKKIQADKAKAEAQKKVVSINLEGSDKKLLRLASQSQEQSAQPQRFMDILNIDESKSASKLNSPIIQSKEELERSCYIKDLYERANGWVLLGRVNYISIVECQNGLFAANFIMSDEIGGEIKCVLFVSDAQQAREGLIVGNCYLFSSGEVKVALKEKQLQITFDRNSTILPQGADRFRPVTRKFIRIDQILDEEHGAIVNVLGAVRRIKSKEQFKSKTKYTATLGDPVKKMEVDFMLFLNNEQRQVQIGMVIILHNFQVFRQQNICRLNSTYKSYYFEQKPHPHELPALSQIHQMLIHPDWHQQVFKNISMFSFTHRTVHDLREICKRTQDQRLYSSLDVWALEILKKKSYNACKNCKKPAERKQMSLFECLHCKRIVQTILTHALSVTFGDYTGSCSIDVIGEHAENLLGMKAIEFNNLSMDEQINHLQSLKYKNITLRLKSEKKPDKRESHSVWGIQKPAPEVTLREVKKQLQIQRLKQEQDW